MGIGSTLFVTSLCGRVRARDEGMVARQSTGEGSGVQTCTGAI